MSENTNPADGATAVSVVETAGSRGRAREGQQNPEAVALNETDTGEADQPATTEWYRPNANAFGLDVDDAGGTAA